MQKSNEKKGGNVNSSNERQRKGRDAYVGKEPRKERRKRAMMMKRWRKRGKIMIENGI